MGALYDQLGGKAAVEAVVEAFYQRVLADPTLTPYFGGINLDSLKRHQRSFLSAVFGAPGAYFGRAMAEAHAPIHVSDLAFDRVVEHLGATLAEAGTDPATIETVADRLAPLRAEIVAAYATGEHEALAAFLDHYRTVLLSRVRGIDEESQRRSLTPTGVSLLGIVKHLTYVERWWFTAIFAGEDVQFPWDDTDPDADWRLEPWESAGEIVALYRAEVRRSRTITASAKPDDLARRRSRSGQRPTLRWILVHLLEETARHCGHADILREELDATTARTAQDAVNR